MKQKRRIVLIEPKGGMYERGMYPKKPTQGKDINSERCVCGRLPAWRYPEPVDLDVTRITKASLELPDNLYPQIMSPSLYEALAPHATTQVFGSVFLIDASGSRVRLPHRTVYDHPGNEICTFGPAGSTYWGCQVCSRVLSEFKGAKQWVTSGQASNLKWALGQLCIFMSEELFKVFPLNEFPDLRAVPVGVVEGPKYPPGIGTA